MRSEGEIEIAIAMEYFKKQNETEIFTKSG